MIGKDYEEENRQAFYSSQKQKLVHKLHGLGVCEDIANEHAENVDRTKIKMSEIEKYR